MLKDVEARRKTEVDAILGFLIAKAKEQGKKAPLVESYYFFIKGKEKIGGIVNEFDTIIYHYYFLYSAFPGTHNHLFFV